jgi:O-antigen/teichoic acid export membrane protein
MKTWNEIKKYFLNFKGLGIIGGASGITNAIGAIFWFLMASLLGTENYGEISYLIAIGVIASRISLVGATNSLLVFIPKGINIQIPIYIISITSSILTSIIVFFVFLNNPSVSLYIVGFVIFTLITSEALGRKSYSGYAKYIISQKLLLVSLSTSLFFIIGFEGVIYGIALSFFPYVIKIITDVRNKEIDFSVLKSKKGFIMNNYLLDLTNAFNGSLDKIIIAPLLGFALLGNYQLGVQFISILAIIPAMVFQYTLPMDASGNSNKILKKLLIIYSVVITIITILLAPIIVPILFPDFSEAVEIIQIISISVIPSTITITLISKYLGNAQSKIVLIGSGIFLGVQIPSILVLGNQFGVNGAAVAIILGHSVQAIYFLIIDNFSKK